MVVLCVGVRCRRGYGLLPGGVRLLAPVGFPRYPGNGRGCWDDRLDSVRTSTGRCFVGHRGFRGTSRDFVAGDIQEFVLQTLFLCLVGVNQLARHFLGQLVEPAFVRPI